MNTKIKGKKSIYTKIMIKSNYKNKWQENYAKWFIELNKKKIFKRISFSEISKDFIFKKN